MIQAVVAYPSVNVFPAALDMRPIKSMGVSGNVQTVVTTTRRRFLKLRMQGDMTGTGAEGQ